MTVKKVISFSLALAIVLPMILTVSPVKAAAVENRTLTLEDYNLSDACQVDVKSASVTAVESNEEVQQTEATEEPTVMQETEAADSAVCDGKDEFAVLATVDEKTACALSEMENTASEYAPGISVIDTIIEGIRILFAGMNNTIVYLQPAEQEPYLEFVVDYYDNEGNHFVVQSGVYYDKENNQIFGKYDTGIYDSGYDFDLKNVVFYSARKAWQRAFGFCALYDEVAQYLTFDYDTINATFNYEGKDWKFQFWKGRYNAFIRGGEMGIYTKPQDREIEFYDCADYNDMMPMSIKVSAGDYVYVDRGLEKHWWMTGFKIGGPIVSPEEMTLEGSLVFKNEEMRDLFTEAMAAQNPDVTCTVDELTVSLKW